MKPDIVINNNPPITVTPGEFYTVQCPVGKTQLKLTLPATVQIAHRLNNAVAVSRGPLLYSLKVGTKATTTQHHAFQSYDWVIMPTSPWNYALEIDQSNPSSSFTFTRGKVGPSPFSEDQAPVMITAKGRILTEWKETQNAASIPPMSPVNSNNPIESVVLIPYGSTRLRIVEFPFINARV